MDDALREEYREYLCPPWRWRDVVRRIDVDDLPKWVKYILLTAADFADRDGTNVRPGVSLLAVESDSGYTRTQEAIRMARQAGLLFLAHRGNRRKGYADEFWLVLHPELMERVKVESPDVRKQRAVSMRTGRHGSWKPAKKADGSPESADESCTPQECTNETEGDPIVHPTGVHDAETSCTPQECLKTESCTPQECLKRGSCTPGECTTTNRESDLPRKATTPSDEEDLSRPVTVRARDDANRSTVIDFEAKRAERDAAAAAAEIERIAAEAAAVKLGPAKCEHNLTISGGCAICRRLSAKASP